MLEEQKKLIVQVARDCETWGLCIPKAGNFSIRDKETGYVLMTPTSVTRQELTYKHIIVMDMDGNIVEKEIENVKPTVEACIHIEAYRQRPDVFGIVHTHSKNASVFAALGKEVPSVIFDAFHYKGKTIIAPYGRPGTDELAETIKEPVKKAEIVLMEKHGVLAVGENIKKAFLNALYVEQVAEIALKVKDYSGIELEPIPQEEFDALLYHR